MNTVASKHSRLHAWLQIIRPPNLPTVPGDPLAGFFLASMGGAPANLPHCIKMIVAALLFYVAGLVWNDCADVAEDARQRPERPLPSGRIKPRTAGTTAAFLAGAGLGICFEAGKTSFAVGGLLVALVLSYNFLTKSRRFLGCLNMGACRGASLLLGASVSGTAGLMEPAVLTAAGGLTLYVLFVTMLAFHETETKKLGYTGVLPVACLVACFAILHMLTPTPDWTPIPAIMATAWAGFWSLRLIGTPGPATVGRSIGGLLRGILLIQATFCALFPQHGYTAAIVLICMIPVSSLLARSFYAT